MSGDGLWQPGGWRTDLENFDRLRYGLENSLVGSLCAVYRDEFEPPKEIDPRPWLKVENQYAIGSCQGQSLSTICEIAYKIATGDKTLQLSRHWSYIQSQRMDGIRGDNGSTLEGGKKVAQQLGICLESTVPYPSQYTAKIPNEEAAKQEAAKYKIRRSTECSSYDDVFNFIAMGLGGVQIGIAWPSAWMSPRGKVLDSFRAGGGGHAVALVGYVDNPDSSGRKPLILANSWGADWCDGGYALVTPKCVEQMLDHSWSVFIGHTDMTTPAPRKWTFNL